MHSAMEHSDADESWDERELVLVATENQIDVVDGVDSHVYGAEALHQEQRHRMQQIIEHEQYHDTVDEIFQNVFQNVDLFNQILEQYEDGDLQRWGQGGKSEYWDVYKVQQRFNCTEDKAKTMLVDDVVENTRAEQNEAIEALNRNHWYLDAAMTQLGAYGE